MSDMSLNHDLYSEAAGRRRHEVEAVMRSRALRRDAMSLGRQHTRRPSVRARVVAVAAPMVTLAALFVTGAI